MGEAYVWQSGTLNKPVVVIEGFDKDEDTDQEELYAALNQQNLIETLRSWDYDIIVLNFNYSKDYIQRNAFLVAKLLHRVNLEKIGTEQLVLIGASMGGLVSRYALTYMEYNSMTHSVRTFISFDSPQNGANIPLGDQYWLEFFATAGDNASAQDNLNKINSVAAKQMLLFHHTSFPYPNSYNTNLMNEIGNLGDYPSNLRKVAVSNGNGTGSGLQLVDDYRLVYWRYRDWRVDIDGHTWAVPNGSSRKIFDGMIDRIWPLPNDGLEVTVGGTQPYDECPGGKSSTNGTIVEEIPNEYTPSKYTYNPDHGFIPMISALDLNTTNLNYNAAADPDILQKTPFDEVYFSSTNEDHVYISQNTYINMLNEITNFNLPPLSVSISGPSYIIVPAKNQGTNSYTWTANVTNGVTPSYIWYKKNSATSPYYQVGTGQTYSETYSYSPPQPPSTFYLKVEVSDIGNRTASAVKAVEKYYDGGILPKSSGDIALVIPTEFSLEPNFPNPFNPSTTIRFGLPNAEKVSLQVYNVNGKLVSTLLDGILDAGYHSVNFNGQALSSGIYFYKISTKNFTSVKRMLLVK